jgi:hypothetical protein
VKRKIAELAVLRITVSPLSGQPEFVHAGDCLATTKLDNCVARAYGRATIQPLP